MTTKKDGNEVSVCSLDSIDVRLEKSLESSFVFFYAGATCLSIVEWRESTKPAPAQLHYQEDFRQEPERLGHVKVFLKIDVGWRSITKTAAELTEQEKAIRGAFFWLPPAHFDDLELTGTKKRLP